MLKLIEIVRILFTLLPLIADGVRAIESLLPEGGQGKAKVALVRQMLEAAFATIKGLAVTFEEAWPALETTVNGVVGLFNATGRFTKE